MQQLVIKWLIVASSWSHVYLLIKDARSLEHKKIEFLIGNLQQWKFEGYNLNLIKISVMKMQLNW